MKYLYFIGLWILAVIPGTSQYTEVINARFPGFSESPYGVGSKVYQLESHYFRYYNNSYDFFNLHRTAGLNLFLRTGFISEKLELNLDVQYEKQHFLINPITETGYYNNGFSRFTLAAKYLFYKPTYKDPSKEIRSWKRKMAYDWKRLIPAIGLNIGWETNFVGQNYKLPGMSPRAALLLQQDLDDWTTLVTNVYADHILFKEHRSFGVLSALTYSIADRFSIFAEGQIKFLNPENKYYIGGGAAYLLSPDLQIGLHARSEVQLDYLDLYAGIGLSWRIDRHKDKAKKTKYKTEEKVDYEEKSFLKRVFSKKGRRGKIPKKKKYRKRRKKGERRTRDKTFNREKKDRRNRRERKPRVRKVRERKPRRTHRRSGRRS